jgi:hypothetical protein
MKTAAMQYAVTVALAGALALTATSGPSAQMRAGAAGDGAVAQYCAPQHESTDLQRIFCREHG